MTRPATGGLVGLGSAGRIYQISLQGVAVAVNTAPSTTPLNGAAFGVDFNPTVDRLRVISDNDQNLRFNPDTGLVAAVDTALARLDGSASLVGAPMWMPILDV